MSSVGTALDDVYSLNTGWYHWCLSYKFVIVATQYGKQHPGGKNPNKKGPQKSSIKVTANSLLFMKIAIPLPLKAVLVWTPFPAPL